MPIFPKKKEEKKQQSMKIAPTMTTNTPLVAL